MFVGGAGANAAIDCPVTTECCRDATNPTLVEDLSTGAGLRLRVRRGESSEGESGEDSNSPQGEFYLKFAGGGGGAQQRCIAQTALKAQATEAAHWRAMRAASWRRVFIAGAILG